MQPESVKRTPEKFNRSKARVSENGDLVLPSGTVTGDAGKRLV